MAQEDHSYVIYEFLKCNDASVVLEEGDPDCADNDAINTWLDTKSAHLRVLNAKVDFSIYSEELIRQNEVWLPAVTFHKGIYTD